ncbi:MAG: replication restart helicase PriA [Desulfobaccales bacterium]
MPEKERDRAFSGESDSLAEVAVALPLFQTLTYRIPPTLQEMARVGCLVRVPVGRRQVTGYILGPARKVPAVRLRNIQEVLDPQPRFDPELVPLWRWVADYYQYPLGEALSHLIPGGSRPAGPHQERWVSLKPNAGAEAPRKRLGHRGKEILAYLRQTGEPQALRQLSRIFPTCVPVLKRLARHRLVFLEDRPIPADPFDGHPISWSEPPITLTTEQEEAVQALIGGLRERRFAPFLLHGVTASGKTEVYLAAAREALNQGRQVLVLLPEIALTHPVGLKFRRRFGERVALLHSGLTDSQRLEQWRRLAAGRAEVAVGARSAVFAPLPRLGLIVVDEEHDPSYKHEGGLPYQARDVALYRGKLAGAAVALVSATPAVATYFRAREGRYRYIHLSRRVTPQALPEVHLINLKEHRGAGHKIISPPLAQAVTDTLARGEQALLFLNRRGYATVMFCLFCGEVFQCRRCSVALTHHHGRNLLLCHYCGFGMPLPERCPSCQSTAIKRHGVGTERLESEVRRLWPAARVGRLDRDTAPTSGRALTVLEDFARKELDILVGTQMITKGHHFPGVTLVGVIAADQGLFFPEYHAGERTFQLLAQVAGRAGRGGAAGTVLIQTYQPEHYVFQTVRRQNYEEFFAKEVGSRRELGYPPFTRLALVRLSGTPAAAVAREASNLAESLRRWLRREAELSSRLQVLGPAPAGLAKLKGRFRWQVLLKSYGRPPLLAAFRHLRQTWSPPSRSKIDLTLDIDPGQVF